MLGTKQNKNLNEILVVEEKRLKGLVRKYVFHKLHLKKVSKILIRHFGARWHFSFAFSAVTTNVQFVKGQSSRRVYITIPGI